MNKIQLRLIPGFDDYCVSEEGKVFRIKNDSLSELRTYVCGGHNCIKLRGKKFYIDNLVAFIFLGGKPEGYKVFHKNKNKLDDKIENLIYLSDEEFYKYSTYSREYLQTILQ